MSASQARVWATVLIPLGIGGAVSIIVLAFNRLTALQRPPPDAAAAPFRSLCQNHSSSPSLQSLASLIRMPCREASGSPRRLALRDRASPQCACPHDAAANGAILGGCSEYAHCAAARPGPRPRYAVRAGASRPDWSLALIPIPRQPVQRLSRSGYHATISWWR